MVRYFIPLVLAATQPAANADQELGVTVLVYDYAGLDRSTLVGAQRFAGNIYREHGVKISWQVCSPNSQEEDCSGPFDNSVLVMRIMSGAMARRVTESASQYGYALLVPDGFPRTATVFFQRISDFCTGESVNRRVFLGLMMAHEIGHLLLGKPGHTRSGVMRAEWKRKDAAAALSGRVRFDREQAERIRANILARQAADLGVDRSLGALSHLRGNLEGREAEK